MLYEVLTEINALLEAVDREGYRARSPNKPVPIAAPVNCYMSAETPALAQSTRAESHCQAASATKGESSPWPTIPLRATAPSAKGGVARNRSPIGSR